ncbi:uncharacterized protein LOC134257088 [Saccostrea cucullata]|uniref:uncharacterized protein LOC134257088 n=1 Tax=Saccostrea cuccullata TaxID=36930 RepID=UPI002ED642DB
MECDPANGCKDGIIVSSNIDNYRDSRTNPTQPMVIEQLDDTGNGRQFPGKDVSWKSVTETVKYHNRSTIIIRKQGDYTGTVLITVGGTSISMLLLVAIGFQLCGRKFYGKQKNLSTFHTGDVENENVYSEA